MDREAIKERADRTNKMTVVDKIEFLHERIKDGKSFNLIKGNGLTHYIRPLAFKQGVLTSIDKEARFHIETDNLLSYGLELEPWYPAPGEEYNYPSFMDPYGWDCGIRTEQDTDHYLERIASTVGVYRTVAEAEAKAKELGWL